MGFYIHSCKKMRYKGEYKPSELLCPCTLQWHDLQDSLQHLNKFNFCPLDSNLANKRYLIAENEIILQKKNRIKEDIERDKEKKIANGIQEKESSEDYQLDDSQETFLGKNNIKSKNVKENDNDQDNDDGDQETGLNEIIKEKETPELEDKRLKNIKHSPLAIFAPQFDSVYESSHPPPTSSSSSLNSPVLPFSSTSIASGLFSNGQRNSSDKNSDNNVNNTNSYSSDSDMSRVRTSVKVSRKQLCSIPLDLGMGIGE